MTKTAYRVVNAKMKLILRIWRTVLVLSRLFSCRTQRQTVRLTGHWHRDLEMDDRITRLEEQMALIQADLFQMSDELFTQQQEIGHLRREIGTLKGRIQSAQSDSGLLKPEEDSSPPHYWVKRERFMTLVFSDKSLSSLRLIKWASCKRMPYPISFMIFGSYRWHFQLL